MTIKKYTSLIISLAIISMLVACGSSSPTPPPPAVVSVALQTGLPTSLGLSTGLSITATVTGDSTNAGADWTVTCGSNACGTFSATHTASGTATTYTSPATVPTGGTVMVTAASTKNSSKTASATFTISAASISISFQAAPPTSLLTSGTTSVTANVTNDVANAGVDWSVTCGSNDCGSFTPTHTASGGATTYTAPATAPTGGSVTIAATSTTDNTKSVTAAIAVSVPITTYNQLLNGTYAFEISGSLTSFNAYQVGGVITADGNGNITGGEQVYNDGNTLTPGTVVSGVYNFGPDGRGTITLTTSTSSIAVAGVETLGAVIVSSSKVLITEFDVSASARGSMDLQTAVNPLNGGYAFVMGSNFPIVFGGVFNVDNNPATGNISGAGSVADSDSFGFIQSGALTGSVSAPDSFGQVTITIDTVFGTGITMSGFIVDDSHIKLVETDSFSTSGGVAIAQGTSTGTYLDNTALSGNLVYDLFGQCDEGSGGTAIAGSLTADGAGSLSGLIDVNFGTAIVVSDTIIGTYAVDGTGTGRATAATVFSSTAPGPNLVIYLTQPNLPPLMLETDDFSLAAGSASVQAAGPYSFSQAYGLNFTSLSGTEADGTAQIVADGTGTFAGFADVNSNLTNTPAPDLAFSGAFTPDPSGRFNTTVSLDGTPYSAAFYFIDSTQGFLIENDSQSVTLGNFYAQAPINAAIQNKKIAARSAQPKNKK